MCLLYKTILLVFKFVSKDNFHLIFIALGLKSNKLLDLVIKEFNTDLCYCSKAFSLFVIVIVYHFIQTFIEHRLCTCKAQNNATIAFSNLEIKAILRFEAA